MSAMTSECERGCGIVGTGGIDSHLSVVFTQVVGCRNRMVCQHELSTAESHNTTQRARHIDRQFTVRQRLTEPPCVLSFRVCLQCLSP